MATPPTLIANPSSALNSTSTPKSVASITVQTGDIIVVQGITGDGASTLGTPTNTNTAQTYTLEKSVVVTNYCAAYCWTAVASTNQAMVISITRGGTNTNFWGFQVTQWRGSDGVGASAVTNVASGAPSLSLTTQAANSAVCVQNGDWTASTGARTWRTVNGAAATELAYFADGTNYGFYAGYHPDAGSAGANTYGLSAPTGQKYSIIAVEIKGTAGGAPALPPYLIMQTRRAY